MQDEDIPRIVHLNGMDFAVEYQEVPEHSWIRGEDTIPSQIREANWVVKTLVRCDATMGIMPATSEMDALGSPIIGFGRTSGAAIDDLASKLDEVNRLLLARQGAPSVKEMRVDFNTSQDSAAIDSDTHGDR